MTTAEEQAAPPPILRLARALLWGQCGYAVLAVLIVTSADLPMDAGRWGALALLGSCALLSASLAAGPVFARRRWMNWPLRAAAVLSLVAALHALEAVPDQDHPQHGAIAAILTGLLLLTTWTDDAADWYGVEIPDIELGVPTALARRHGLCAVCEAAPAAEHRVSAVRGLLFLTRRHHIEVPLCRDHGLATYRRFTLYTLRQGWWGYLAFFVTIATLLRNLAAYRAYRRLPAPPPHPERDRPPRAVGLAAVGSVLLIPVMVTALAAGVRYAADRSDNERPPPMPTFPHDLYDPGTTVPGPGTTVPGSGTDLDDNLGRLDDLNGAGEG